MMIRYNLRIYFLIILVLVLRVLFMVLCMIICGLKRCIFLKKYLYIDVLKYMYLCDILR